MFFATVRQSRIYNVVVVSVAVCGVFYLFWKSFIATADEVDFKYVWLAGIVWAKGGDPYSAAYANTAQLIFSGLKTNVPQFWYYGPNWWPISRLLATVDLSAATQIWRGSIIVLIGVGSFLFYRALPFFGQKISLIELVGFIGVASLTQAAAITISTGQTSALIFCGLGALTLGLVSNGRYLITAGTVLLLLKPQIGLVFVPALLVYRPSRVAVVVAGLISGLMAAPALIGQDVVAVVREYMAQASSHGSLPGNLPLETTGLRHALYAFTGLTVSSLTTTLLAGLIILVATIVLRMNRRGADKPGSGISAWVFFAIATAVAIVSLHKYDLVLVAPLLLLSAGTSAVVQALTWVGFLIVFRSGNLVFLFEPRSYEEQLSVSTAIDTVGIALVFCAGLVGILLSWNSNSVDDDNLGKIATSAKDELPST